MRFLEIPALITEDIETPDIVDITEPITASIDGTTLTIDGGNKVSGESTITLTGDVTVNTITKTNLREPSIHKISVKTNGKGNFTYTPNTGVTASSVSSTIKTGSDFEILLITTSGGDTYLDLDLADYTSPAVNFNNALTGFNITDLTSTYGATAKLYKPDGTLLSTTSSATIGSGVGFGAGVETTPGEVNYKLEVTDDVGRKSTYDLPRKWISYAMETNSTPGFQKFKLGTNEYTSTTVVPNLSSTTKARVYKTTDHGYLGINFKIQGRNSTSGAWTDIDTTAENVESDESAEFLAFGDYLYHRVWVKPTAQATTTVSSSNVVTLTLSNVTEDVTKTISGADPYMIDEVSNAFVFDELSRVGTVPFTITLGSETYTDSVSATTEERSIATTPNTDFTEAGPNMKHYIAATPNANYMCQASGDGRYIVYHPDNNNSVMQVLKGDGENGFTNYATFTYSQASSGGKVGSVSYDGKYVLVAQSTSNSYSYEIWKNDESTSTFTKLSQTVNRIGDYNHTYKPSFVPRSGNYDFCITGTDNNNNFDIQLYKHNEGTDTWTAQTIINDPANRPSGNLYRGFFACQFTRDGKYLMLGAYSTYGGYAMYTIDWDANTAVFSGAHWHQNNNIGHSGTVTPDGKYVLIFHNDGGSRRIFKNNDAGDWSSATEIHSDFTFDMTSTDQGNDISFFGEHGEYFVSLKDGGHVRVYQWLDVINKGTTLTYNGKDKLTIAHTGGITPSSVKLYKDGVLYHTFGSELSVFINETGVYQAISDERYFSAKVTVTTITETQAEIYMSHRTCFLLKKDGKVWYWGESNNGSNAMGNNTQVPIATLNDNLNALPSGIKQISRAAVDAHCRAAITNDGKLYTWGFNGHGGLGRGNESDYTSQGPWLVDTQSSNTFTFCHSAYYENFALQDNGYLWAAGHGGHYLMGNGSTGNQNRFVRINLPNVIDFDANHDIALALTNENKVYIWGRDGNNSMGGATGTTATPTHMTALDGKNIVKVRTAYQTGYVISSDGKVYAWGRNDSAQIPKGSSGNVSTPEEMTWFTRNSVKVVDIKAGHNNTTHLALDDQGNMYVWGGDSSGSIGDGTGDVTNYHVPFLLKTNIASITSGYNECGCIDKFGQVYTWGDAQQGQQNWIHGSNSDTDIYLPTSNNLSVGSTIVFDGFDKYVLGKDSTVTSNVTFGSNTVSLGTKSEVFITDPHTYKFKIMDTDSVTYTSNVISTVSRPTERVYPPKSGTHKDLSLTASANTDNTWTIDGALYGNGAYKASMDKTANHVNQCPYRAFTGTIDYSSAHTQHNVQTSDFQLHMPQKIKLTKYAIYSRNYTGDKDQSPKDWKVYGSNDNGTNWTELDSQTNQTVSTWGDELDFLDTKREYTVTGNTKYFSSYKFDVTANNGNAYLVISQIEYYGDEEGFLSDDGYGKLTLDVKGDTDATSNITFHSNTYTMGAARELYIKDTGEYSANIYGSSKAFLGEKTHTVGTQDLAPGFTAAFHYGAFSSSDYSSAYSSVSAAATAGFVYSDTPTGTYTWGTLDSVTLTASTGGITDYVVGKTQYTYTPASAFTGKLLMVAGGGGGGGTIAGGGGGGGLLYNESASFTAAQKTIVVGDGGIGGGNISMGINNAGKRGHDTSISGFTTAVGGGAGGGYSSNDSATPSYGGSGGGYKTSYTNYSATTGQGNQGGEITGYAGGGGGGAGGAGADSGNAYSGAGGVGKDYGSVFGTIYGESGWFAAGGGGGGRNDNNAGNAGPSSGGNGGGGDGSHSGNVTVTASSSMNGQLHTGGGGGGGGWNGTNPSGSVGGKGGSGIVIIKKDGATNPPALNFDGYNKLSIDNDGNSDTGMKNVTISGGPWNNHVFKPDDIAQKGKFQWDLWNQPTGGSQYKLGDGHSLEYVLGYGWYIINIDGTSFGDVSPTSATEGTYVDVNGATQNFSTNYASSSGGVLTIAHTGGTMTVNESDFFEGGVIPPKTGSIESVTIKKDGAAFATTTSNTVYIHETGTYTAEVKGSGAYVTELSKVVSVTPTHKLDYSSTETTINGSDLDGADNYGQTMCGYGDTVAIAAPGEDTSASNSGAVYIWKRTGTTWAQEAKLKSPNPGSNYYFGYAQMSMIENKIAIGEIGANKVHVFTRSGTTWTLAQTLSGSGSFGRGVALYGNYLAVGADNYDSNRGRVHIYTFTGGSPKTSIAITGGIYYNTYTGCYYELDSSQNTENSRFFELKASDGTPQFGTPEIYGFEVRRSGTTYTAYANTGGNTDEPNELSITSTSSGMAASVTLPTTGQLYGRKQSNYGTFETESVTWADVFNGSYGSEVTISSPHGNINTQFGSTLSLYGTSLAIGAYADDQKAYQAGRAYIYVYDGSAWAHQASLDDDLVANDYAHEVFLIDADTLMFGNFSEGTNGCEVFYYTRSGTTWTLQQTITASDGSNSDSFGKKIWATSDTLIVGARHWEGSSGSNRGKIYIYEKENGTWTEKKTYTKVSNAADADYFGESVWTDGTYFVSGAMSSDDKGTNSGSAHVYTKIKSGPTLTYDGLNKYSIEGVTAPSSNLTFGSVTTNIGSAKDVYIRDAGTYSFHTNDGNQALLMSNTVSSTPSGTTYDDSHNQNTNIGLNKEIDSVSGYFGEYTHGALSDSASTSDLNFTKTILTNGYPTDFSVVGANVTRPNQTLETGQWHSNDGGGGDVWFRINLEKDHFVDNCVLHRTAISSTRYQNVRFQLLDSSETQIKEVNVGDFGATDTFVTADCKVSGVRYVKVVTTSTSYTHYDEIRINGYDSTLLDVSGTTPSQVYDNTKTITVSNIPSTQTGITGKFYKDATAYTIHATQPTSNVVIKNTGTYLSVFTTASTVYFTNAVTVSATPDVGTNTIEDGGFVPSSEFSGTVAFHHGTFADSGDPYSDGSVTVAATNGHIFSDTATGEYTWGTLGTPSLTADTNTSYTWTPPGTATGTVLMVAGGGGGGGIMGGGGGAGGLVFSESETISGTQTIVVGDGGGGAVVQDDDQSGKTGNDTTFLSYIAAGGGAGYAGGSVYPISKGGSGGGYSSGTTDATDGDPTQLSYGGKGFGNAGGSGSGYSGGGGGGAGTAGQDRDNSSSYDAGAAGAGKDYSSTFGTTYGESGWFAGGGGGGGRNDNNAGAPNQPSTGGQGGGGDGTLNTGSNSSSQKGVKHTGGGGGGSGWNSGASTGDHIGGDAGSGIVLVKFTAKTLAIIPWSTAIAPAVPVADAPSVTLDATTEVATPTMNLDFTATMTNFPRTLKRYNGITSSSIGARFNRTESKKKRVHKLINTDTFSIELTANNMGDSSSSSSTLPVTVINSGAGTQYTSGWTTGSTSSFVVPSDAPNTLYYYCQNHNGMGGSISVSSASTTTHTVTVVSSSAGTQYTSGWTASGTPGSSGGINTFIAPSNAPSTLYYYCGNHSGMGGAINMVSGPVSTTFAVTVQSVGGYYGSSNKYFIDGTQQATISLVRGKTYTFNNNASGSHPMYFATSSDGTTYTSGVTNGGSSSVTFAVPLNAPSTLYYKCGNHGGMGGTINILGPTASPLAVTVAGGKFVIGGVSQATLQLVRGETYVFNQENSTNGTHPLRLSETSNGTHVVGGSGFYIGGTQRPTLSMVRGNTYTFDQTNASNGSHVLQIATSSDGTQYTTGYTTGTFVVPLSAPDTLYYKSSTTAGMGGLINITGSSTSAFIVTAGGGKFSIGGVEQASLSVIRGLTYTFDQTDSSNSTHVLLLSSTSDGTRNTGVNKYYISGVETPTLTFIRGNTYTFDQSDSTNGNHPIRLSATSNGTHASGSQYTSGWTTTGTPGSSGASSQFIVPANAPSTLYYYCQHHSGMGGASSINVADSNSGILLTYGTHALVANATVSGEYTIATNFDGTTSNLYVNGALITSASTSVTSGAKTLKIGEDYNGFIKNLKFWNYAKRFFPTGILESYSSFYTNLTGAYSVRLLFSNYTGAHVSIKRSSDNAEVDVTFDKNGVVVTPTDWTSWSGSDTLYVMKWYDQSGNNKFGTASGNPTYDKTNKRVVFDSDDYFTLPNGVAPTGDSAYSIIAYHNTISATDGGIFGSGNYGSSDQVLALRRNTSNYTNYWWGDDLDGGTYAANTVVSATYRASGTTRSFYTNGVASSTTTTTTRNGVAGNETIGVTNNNGGTFQEYLEGELYELLVFDTGLSASTISGISTTLKTY